MSLPYLEYDYVFKYIIVGDSGVGKSSLLLRFSDGFFQDNYISTIGVDFRIRTVEVAGKAIKLNVWDTAGQDRFKTLCAQYYRGAHAVAITYDITDAVSFENVKTWYKEIRETCSEDCVIFIIGNKSDQGEHRVISHEQGKALADSLDAAFLETSAKSDVNVYQMFMSLSEETYRRLSASGRLQDNIRPVHLSNIRPVPSSNKKGLLSCADCTLL